MFAYALIHEKYSWIIGCDNVSNILRQIETCDVSIFNDNNNNNILTQIEKTYVQSPHETLKFVFMFDTRLEELEVRTWMESWNLEGLRDSQIEIRN